MSNKPGFKPTGKDIAKFIIMSIIGAFLFLALIPDGDGGFNIPLGIAIDWLTGLMRQVTFVSYAQGYFSLDYILALIAITISFLGTLVAVIFKPGFIMNNEKIKGIFYSAPIYFISKAIGFAIVWMLFLGIGPDFLINNFTGDVMIRLVASLMVIFIFLAPAMPLLTSFGLMEFVGTLIRKVIRVLFTLPGRSSIDLMASWFGSSAAAVIITRDQHEKGFYTGREAAVNATCFAMVSLPFTFVIASTLDLTSNFLLFYGIICFVSLVLAVIMPRLWPLRGITNDYLPEVGKQIEEEVPTGTSTVGFAFQRACQRASGTTAKEVVKSGAFNYLNIFMDLIPIILAWGTLALVLAESPAIPVIGLTVFEIISWPMGGLLSLLQVPEAFAHAPATLIGFVDMFIPALMLSDAPDMTRFIIGALSIVQIIYLAETGVLIIKSKIPLGIGKLFVIFMMRTLIALPLIVLLARLFFNA